MTLTERIQEMAIKRLREEKAALMKKVEELEEGEAYEVEHEMADGSVIRMDYVRYRQFMRDMAAGAFNGNG
ncbi:hypothetical protein [Bacillus cereus]|uniref:hypothetical protein n=1 Tax=Bacillus cereus TaxID=1396 RepID=UPI002406D65A|nr:hypothetical protein [Bacillus cereus]MDF9638834.1 hypothetical protein [Bacillus cereus]